MGLSNQVWAVHQAGIERQAQLSEETRRRRGVVHTPPEVAGFMARRADEALRRIGAEGLRDPRVCVVDPACGPGIFLAAATATGGPGRRLGLDVDEASLRTARQLLGANPSLELRAGNTLAEPLGERELSGTLVILGNPPWAGRSANVGATYTDELLADFRRFPNGEALEERKLGVLSDDYIRFLRWSAEQIRRARGGGLLCLVTNGSYLDGPVHRAMRARLIEWFTEVEIIDLGGSALIARRGDRDDNVFGVRPNAAILVAARPAGPTPTGAKVRYARMRGSRREKLARLTDDAVMSRPITVEAPGWRFVSEPPVPSEYLDWVSLDRLFPFHREGVQTNRDAMCVDADREALLERLRRFADGADDLPGRAAVATRHYSPENARRAVREALEAGTAVQRIAYRPLDARWAALVPKLCHRRRPALLDAMARSRIALLTVRKDRGELPWTHFGATHLPVDNCFLSTRSACRTRAFPSHAPDGSPNLDATAASRCFGAVGALPSPAQAVHYALGILAARDYRERYRSRLMVDYPRLPSPRSRAEFGRIVAAGEDIATALTAEAGGSMVQLGHHQLRSSKLARAIERADDATAPLWRRVRARD